MLSITPISAAGAEHYYTRADEYYREHETAPSAWEGKGAERLGLSGSVETEQFKNLLSGRSPDGSSQLISGSRANNDQHRAGYDLTFSAPKSVSVLALAAKDERLISAHDNAVKAVLSHAGSTYAETRRYIDGVQQRVLTHNWVIATYRHDLSRALDPQLHTHAIILNATQRDDGAWRAITAEKLLSAKMELGAVYRNELAARVQAHGYQAEWGERGFFEIRGVGQETLNAFSRRAEQIDAAAERLKAEHPEVEESKIREWATLASRATKETGIDRETLRADWQARVPQVRELGTVVALARERADGRALTREGQGMGESGGDARDIARLAAQRLTEAESVFTRQEWMQTASQLAAGKATTDQLAQAMDRLSTGRADRAECPRLGTRDDGEQLYSTRSIYEAERAVLRYAADGRGQQQTIMTAEQAQQTLSSKNLSQDQFAAARGILTSSDRIVLIQGDAGTGKTTMLRSVREAAEAKGWTVLGLAYTGQAAKELREGAGIHSETAHRILAQLAEQGPGDSDRHLWVIDENSMLGSRQMKDLIDHAREADAKIIMVGDVKQLPSISAGRLFTELQERQAAQTFYLTEVKRQIDPSYRSSVLDMAAKRLDEAFATLARDGRLHEYGQHATSKEQRDQATAQVHQQIAHEYAEQRAHGKDVLAVSFTRDDARALNAAIRSELKAARLTGVEDHTWNVREAKSIDSVEKGFAASYRPGDTLVCLAPHQDHDGLGWKPGTVATVTGVDRSTNSLTVEVQNKNGANQTRTIHLTSQVGDGSRQQADCFATYETHQANFSKGDTVVFLKNDRQLDVRNGQRGEIVDVSAQAITVRLHNDSIKSFGRSEYNYVTHGYAVTDYKSQGGTAQRVIVHADAGRTPTGGDEARETTRAQYQNLYVALTRGREDVQVHTPSLTALREHAGLERIKTSTLDREPSQQQERAAPERQSRSQEAGQGHSQGGGQGCSPGGGAGGGGGGR